MENLQVGLLGWQWNHLSGPFYPEDLPQDWQLDYYSNAFRVVLVPQQEWTAWDQEVLEAVIESVESPFCFYFAIDSVEESLTPESLSRLEASLKRIVATLKDQACGVVLWSETPFSEHACIGGLPVTLISKTQVLPGWSWQNQQTRISGEPLAYVSELTTDAKAQVALLKAFRQSLVESGRTGEELAAPFIIDGAKADMVQVANLKVLAEFLGY